jgi:RNA polymerase sigma-70 factor (ECF subfamily)
MVRWAHERDPAKPAAPSPDWRNGCLEEPAGPVSSSDPRLAGDATAALQEIADPDSALNRQWDEEHDGYVVRCLLGLVEAEFEPITLQAFRRLALDGVSSAQAAQELGIAVPAVYVAKSRVLARIRQEAEGLID